MSLHHIISPKKPIYLSAVKSVFLQGFIASILLLSNALTHAYADNLFSSAIQNQTDLSAQTSPLQEHEARVCRTISSAHDQLIQQFAITVSNHAPASTKKTSTPNADSTSDMPFSIHSGLPNSDSGPQNNVEQNCLSSAPRSFVPDNTLSNQPNTDL